MQSLALAFVGDSLIRHDDFCDYAIRKARSQLGIPSCVSRFSDNDKNLFLSLEYLVKNSHQLILLSPKESLPTVMKLIATLHEDTLIWKNERLIPSKTLHAEKGSYLLELEGCLINLLEVDELGELPAILLPPAKEEICLYLMGIDEESALLLLSPLAQSHNLSLKALSHAQGFGMLLAKPLKFSDEESFLEGVKALFGEKILPASSLASKVVEILSQKKHVVTTAESCTGGDVAQILTQIPGASEVFHGGVITYDNEIKERWLEVEREHLDLYGAVSEAVVKDMLKGALRVARAHYSLAISGIAGPGGGSDHKPVGTVFIGVRSQEGQEIVERLLFKGDRRYIQRQAALHGLYLLLRLLLEGE